ncbi:MAG: TRAP transporter large permease subunit [Chloroflexi bacterium]|nr:TRAP transporter large permease subunit [Chloroflexota bacterium]
MEWQVTLALIGGSFLVLLILGVPIAASMGVVGAVYILLVTGNMVGLEAIGLGTMRSMANYDLFAITFYVLIGELMLIGGLADDMFQFASKWLNRLPGGLAVVSIAVATLFATCSGSSAASTSTIGKISIPQMLERGYDKRLAVGSVAASGGLAHLIPPSILMVVYASFNDLPVGHMLLAGLIPGLLLAGLYTAVAVTWALRWPNAAPREASVSWRERMVVLRKLLGPMLVAFAVLGTIMLGIATVTEASVMGAVMALILVVIRRRYNGGLLRHALRQTIITTTFIVFIIVGAKLFSWVLNYSTIPQYIVEAVADLPVTPTQLIILFMVMYFILGMFLDTIGQIFITMPIILPILLSLGYSPLWFGILFFINVEMGMVTPPYGIILYVLKGIVPDNISMGDIIRGSIVFFLGDITTLTLVMAFPAIALWLPGVIFGS